MLEIAAILLTFGAVLYHSLHANLGTVAIVSCLVTLFFALLLRSVRGVLFAALLGAYVLLGALTVWRIDTPIPPGIFGKRAFDARVISVDRRLDRTLIVVTDKEYARKLQVSVPEKGETLPGDTVAVRGNVEAPKDFETNNGRIFGYRAYLASKGIVGVVNNALINTTQAGKFSLTRTATVIRYKIADIFSTYISFPFDGVIAGMTVGYQGGLPSSIQDLFRNTGVLHVLVLSGYNITLLAGFLAIALKGISFRVRNIVTVIAILLLVMVSGAGVASVRAGIMGGIAIFAGLAVRTYQPIRALVIAYLFFFFASPSAIFTDPGFHLSFLATLFMVVVLPKAERIFSFIPKTRHIDVRELLMLALTVPIFMLPYMMYFSGNFPLASPLANILFSIVTPLLMVGGVVVIATSWVAPLAALLGTLISAFGTLLLWLLRESERLPLWNTPAIPWWMVSLTYAVFLCVLFRCEISEYGLQYYKHFRRKPS